MAAQIRVAVIARAGLGKSMVAQIISEALAAKGLDVTFIEDEHGPRDAETVEAAVHTMQERGTTISVESVNARRDGTSDLPPANLVFPGARVI